VDTQHYQPRIEVVGHVLTALRDGADAPKVAAALQVLAQPALDLDRYLVGVALELFSWDKSRSALRPI
jgi:hypothetical protein